jgi:hypothetical protein
LVGVVVVVVVVFKFKKKSETRGRVGERERRRERDSQKKNIGGIIDGSHKTHTISSLSYHKCFLCIQL